MAYSPKNPNGQATMANSEPVVIASDQSAVPVSATNLDIRDLTNADVVTAELSATDNAVLDAIAASVAAIDTDTTTIIGHVDGIETLATSTNTKLDTLITQTDAVESTLTTIEGDTSAIQTAVQLLDDTVATLGTDTYTEAATKGLVIGAVRRDANTTLVNTTNEVAPLQVNATGELKTAIIQALPTGANVIGALTANQSVNVAQINGVAPTMGNGASGTGVQRVTLASDSTGNIATIGTSVTPGTAAANLGKARDAVAGASDTAVGALYVRRDTPTAVTPVAGDYEFAQISANGEQWVRLAGEIADDAAFTVATTRVVPVGFLADETATDSVDEGDGGAARMTLDRKQIVSTYAHTAGGATPYKLVSAATTNATSVKASAGTLYMVTASNVNAAARYLKLYNKASAPTVGTDTPAFTFIIPGNTAGAGTNIPIPNVGINFSTGIAFALTTEATDAGSTAVAASEIVVNLAYA